MHSASSRTDGQTCLADGAFDSYGLVFQVDRRMKLSRVEGTKTLSSKIIETFGRQKRRAGEHRHELKWAAREPPGHAHLCSLTCSRRLLGRQPLSLPPSLEVWVLLMCCVTDLKLPPVCLPVTTVVASLISSVFFHKIGMLPSDFSYNHPSKWTLPSCLSELSQNQTFSPNKRSWKDKVAIPS